MLVSDLQDIGNALREQREVRRLTQAQLAELAGITLRAYSNIERGSTNMGVQTLQKICGALEITPDCILVKRDLYESYSEESFVSMLSDCSSQKKEEIMRVINAMIE